MLVIEAGAGILFTLVFVYFAVLSAQMRVIDAFWTGAGAFPLIVSFMLVICGAIWTIGSFSKLRETGAGKELGALVQPLRSKGGVQQVLRFAVALGFSLLYIFGLLRWLGFNVATIPFLTVMCMMFGRVRPVPAVITSVIVTGATYVAFRYVLMLPLP